MALSVYVHIPYCLQRCRYCDFTTFEQSEILPPEKYTGFVLEEIRNRHHLWKEREIQTLYFGGGTPSLVDPELIVLICKELANAGFTRSTDFEGTLEINPATINEAKLEKYLEAGLNRFSVGAQTFEESLLKLCGRRHTAQDTRETLRLLKRYDLNYSFDLLFALPGQTLTGLKADLEEVAQFDPAHLSAYCLTVPEGHPMSSGRPPEGEQVEMFALIESSLETSGLYKYEISNFAKAGYESRHNQAYWTDRSYWGIGLSSHSYDPHEQDWGLRFWNPKSLRSYEQQASRATNRWEEVLPSDQWEKLQEHESLTDFNHMHLRMRAGLPEDALHHKYGQRTAAKAISRLKILEKQKLVQFDGQAWFLTTQGQLISNKVFEELTFSANELKPSELTALRTNPY